MATFLVRFLTGKAKALLAAASIYEIDSRALTKSYADSIGISARTYGDY